MRVSTRADYGADAQAKTEC